MGFETLENRFALSVSLGVGGSPMAEAGGTATVTALLDAPAASDQTIELDFAGSAQRGTNYTASANSIVIPAGSTSSSITLTGIDDGKYDGNQAILVSILNSTDPSQQVTVAMTDAQSPPTVSLAFGSNSFAESAGSDTLTASLSAVSAVTTVVPLSYSGQAVKGTNFTTSADTITIPAGSTTGSITIAGIDDHLYTGNQSLVVGMGNLTNATPGSPAQATATIDDAESPPTVNLTLGGNTFQENGGSDTVTATLSAATGVATTIPLTYSGTAVKGSNFSTSADTITIPAGSTTGTMTITGIDDKVYTGGNSLSVGLGTLSGAVAGADTSVTASIVDAESTPTVSLALGSSSFSESGGTDSVTATLSAASGVATTIPLSYSGTAVKGTNFSTSADTITIPAGSTTGTATIVGIDDGVYTNGRTLTVSLGTLTNAAAGSPSSATAAITDAQAAPSVDLSASAATIAESGGTTTITATLSGTSGLDTTIPLTYAGTAAKGTNFTTSADTITIPAGSTTGTITVTGVDDKLYTGGETLSVGLGTLTNAAAGSTATTSVAITDAESEPSVSLTLSSATLAQDAGSTTVTATLSAASGVNTTITFAYAGTATKGSNYSTSADTITIPAGSTSDAIHIIGIPTTTTSDQTVIVSIGSATNATNSGSSVTATLSATPSVPASLAPTTSSVVTGTTDYISTSTPSFTLTADPEQTVQLYCGGSVVATATPTTTAGQYTVSVPAGKLALGANALTLSATGINGLASSQSTAVSVIYAPSFAEVYTVPGAIGSSVTLNVSYSSHLAEYNSEFGYYVCSDATGTVNGIAPGASGYAAAALAQGKTIFAGSAAVGNTTSITLTGGQWIAFYFVQNSSLSTILSSNSTDAASGSTIAFFSIDSANPDGLRHALTTGDPTTGNVQYGWEDQLGGGDSDYNDEVFALAASTDSGPSGGALRVPGNTSDTSTAAFTLNKPQTSPVSTAAASTATALAGDVGFYYVSDSSGTVNGIAPGASGYAAAALASGNYQVLFTAGSSFGNSTSQSISGNKLIAFFSISSGSVANYLSANSSDAASATPLAMFSYTTANPDGLKHLSWQDIEGAAHSAISTNPTTDPLTLHVLDELYSQIGTQEDFSLGMSFT